MVEDNPWISDCIKRTLEILNWTQWRKGAAEIIATTEWQLCGTLLPLVFRAHLLWLIVTVLQGSCKAAMREVRKGIWVPIVVKWDCRGSNPANSSYFQTPHSPMGSLSWDGEVECSYTEKNYLKRAGAARLCWSCISVCPSPPSVPKGDDDGLEPQVVKNQLCDAVSSLLVSSCLATSFF